MSTVCPEDRAYEIGQYRRLESIYCLWERRTVTMLGSMGVMSGLSIWGRTYCLWERRTVTMLGSMGVMSGLSIWGRMLSCRTTLIINLQLAESTALCEVEIWVAICKGKMSITFTMGTVQPRSGLESAYTSTA